MTIQRAKDYFDHPNECPFCYSEEIESQHSIHEKHNVYASARKLFETRIAHSGMEVSRGRGRSDYIQTRTDSLSCRPLRKL